MRGTATVIQTMFQLLMIIIITSIIAFHKLSVKYFVWLGKQLAKSEIC